MHIKQHYLLWVKEIIKVLEIALVLIVFISPGESMGIVLLVLMLLLFLTRSTPFDIVSLGVSTKNKCIFSLFFQYVLIGFMRPLRFFWKFCGSLDVTKTVSAMTLVCFLISSVLGQGFASFLAQQQETRQLTHVVDGFTLPPYLGKITDARFYGSKEIVINIQDLHCHSEVQKNISAIIKLLNEKLGVEKVYLEGAVGAVDTSWLGNFPDKKLKTEVAQALIEKGMITGAEYYSVLSGKPQLITGLENEQLYTENVGRLNRILSDRKKMEGIVTALTKQLEPLSETFYCRKNQRFESIIKKYRAGKIDSRKYYVFLRKYGESIGIDVTSYKNIMNYQALIDEQKRLNYSRLTHELQQFVVVLKQRLPYAAYRSVSEQTNNFSRLDNLCFSLSRLGKNYPFISDIVRDFPCLGQFFVYVQASQRLNPLTLVREEQKLVSDIKYKLADSESEREVVFLNNYMLYLNDYVNNKIAAADCDYCENNINRFTFVWGKYESDSLVNELVPYLATLKDFYRVNKQRNLCFVKNLMLSSGAGVLRTSNGENDVDTILPLLDRSSNFKVTVMGGFHTEGFTEILKEKHISYLVITPNVTQKADAAEKIYTDTIEQQARESAVIAAQTLAVQALSENPLEMKKLKVLTAFLSYQLAKGIKKDDIEKDLHSILALLGDPRDKNATFAFTHVNSIENFGFIITSTLEGQQVTNTYEYNQGKYTLHGDKISRISSHAELRRGVISWLKGLWVFITNIGRSTGISEKKVPTAEKPSTEEYILQSMLADHVDFGWANRWYGLYRNHADKEAFGNAVKRLLFNADESIYRGAAWILSQPEFLGPVPAMDNGHDQTSSVVSWNDQSVLSILLFWYDRKTQKLIENFYIDNKNDSSKQQMILAQMISAAIHTKEKNLPKNRALDAIYDLLNLNISIKDILSHTDPDLYEKLTRDNIDLNIPGNGKFGISPYRAQKLGLQPFTSESPFLSPLGADDVLIERSALETLDNATRGVEKPSLVAIGDVHGKIDLFKDALVHAGLAKFINNGVTWTGGTATLVLTGDIVNGQKTKEVFELIKKLAALADIDGGQIVWTLGNHDVFSDIKGGQGGRGKQGYEIWPEVANILINKSVKGLTIAGAYFAQGKIFVHGGIVPFVEHTIQQEITAQKKRINPGQVTTTASPQEIVNYINTTLIHYLDNKTDHRMYTNDADLPDIFKPGTSRDDHPILPHEEGYKPGGIFNAGDIELALSESDIEYPQIIAHSSSEFGFPRDTTGGRVDAEAKIITLDVGRKRRNGNSYLIFNGWAWIAVNPEDGHREIIHVTPAFTRIAQTTLEKMINVKTWSGLTSDKKESILLKVFSQTLSHLQQRESGKKEVQSDSKSVRGNRETVRRLLSMIGEATRRVIARHNENVLERGSESKIRVTQTTEEVDNPQAIALDIAKATRALAHDDNSKNLKQALELMDEWEKMDRKTTAPYQPVAFVELILVKAKEIIEETKLSSNTFGPDYKKSAMVYRLISRLALATAGDIEKALALNSLDKKQRDDLSQLKEKFGVVSLYALEYLRAIDYASVLEVLSAYFYNRAAWMERFNIAPLIRKIFSMDKGFKQSKKGLLTQLALVAALGNYIKPGLYDRTKMYPAMNSYIETLEYKNGHHEFLWDTLWDNRKALQYTLTVVVGVIILIVAPPTFSFGITGIPSLLSSGFIVNIILHWFFISKGTKDTFYTTNKAITQRYLAGASELAAVISVAHQAMPEAMQAPASLPEGDLPIVDVAQHYFTLWAGALEEPDFGGAQLQTILESVSTIMLRTRLSPALLDVPNMGLIANIYDRYLELSEETMKKIAELDVSDPKLKVMAAKITVAHKYAYEYNRAIDYAYTRQMLSNYKIASNSRLYFLEKVKIASIVRLILGISVATGASRVLLKNKIEKIIVLGNKVIPSMYKNPDVLINYVHDKSNNNESIALPEVGLSGPWKTRRMLSRFVPLLLLARPFIIALVSAHPVTMGAFLFSFISGFGLVMVLHWVPVLLSFYSRNFHQHRRFGERLISAGDLTDELNEDLVLKAGEYADIIKRHALGQPRTVVTIVGDPLVGTSTFAKELASAIDFNYLDVESLYRLITVKALHQGIDLNSTTAVNAFVNKNFNSEQNISQLRLVNGDMHWGDEIVSAQELKTFDIKMNSAIVERNQLVQEWVSAVAISAMNEEKNWVVDGTIPSIPTVAEFYVSAFADLRAWRKLAFYVTSGEGFSFTEEEETNLLENIRKLGAASSMNRTKARAQGLYEIPADTALKTSNTYGVIVSMMEHMVHKINTMTPLTYQIDASGRYAGKFTGAEARRKFLAEREEGLNKNAAEHHTRPSNKRYPWMWYWDTILQGMGMLHFNIPRIKDEILTFISAQWPNGMFPNMVRVFISENIQEAVRRFFIAASQFNPIAALSALYDYINAVIQWKTFGSIHNPQTHSSGITQPPIAAEGVLAIYRMDVEKNINAKEFLEKTFDQLYRNFKWIESTRINHTQGAEGWGLMRIIHAWETGADSKVSLDRAYPNDTWFKKVLFWILNKRYIKLLFNLAKKYPVIREVKRNNFEQSSFEVCALDMSSFLYRNLEALAEIALELGKTNEVGIIRDWQDELKKAILGTWNEHNGGFMDFGRVNGTFQELDVMTPQMFLPLYAFDPSKLDKESRDKMMPYVQRMVREIFNPETFWTKYPLPTVAINDPSYNPKEYWRGDTWVNINYFIIKGLIQWGYRNEAKELIYKTLEMIDKGGPRERFNSQTGKGLGAHNFGWTNGLGIELISLLEHIERVEDSQQGVVEVNGASGSVFGKDNENIYLAVAKHSLTAEYGTDRYGHLNDHLVKQTVDVHFKNGIAGLGELWDQVIGDPVLGAGGEHQRDIAIIIVPISSLKKENGANLSDKDQRQAALRIKVLPTASTSPVEGKSVTLLSGKHPETVWETASIGSQDYETSIKTEHGDKNIRVQHFRLPPQDEVLQSGDSGSPVIDSQTGEVVGILTGPVLRIHPSPVAVVSAEDIWAYTEHFRSTMKMTSANHYRQRSTLPALLGEQVQELLERLWKTNEDLAQFLENPSVELANILSGRGSILPSWNEGEIIYSDLREMIQRIIGMRREEFGIESNSTINVKIVTLTDESLVNTNDSYLLATMGIEQHSNASGATDYTIIFSVHNRFWEALRSRASPQREQLQWRLAFHEIDEYLALRYPQSATGQLFSSYLLEHVLHKTTATARELDEIRTSANFHMYIDFLNSLNKKQLRSLSSRETVESAEQRMHNIGDQSKILRFSREVMELDPIIRSFKNAHPKSKESTVERMRAAYEIAVKSYGDSQYVPGKKNLLRFVEDAQTIAQWGGEDSAIVAALLGYSSPDDLRKLWKRRTISKGEAEKLGTMFERRKHNAMLPYVDEDIIKQLRVGDTLDNYIKMIIKNAGDDQTLLLFFVDKLRAVADASTPQERDYRYNELMQVYVPLAMRLNRFDIADDLRDGAMSLIYPHEYAAIKEDVEKNVLKMKRTEAADDLSEMGRELEMWLLGEKGVVKPIVRTRVKSIYSIWEKISSSRREEYTSAEMLNDILGIHIIVESESGRFNTTRYVRGRFESMGYTTTQEETTEKQRGYVSTKLLFSTPGKPPYEVFVFSKAQYDKYRFGLEEAIEGTETVDSQKHAVIPHWIYKLGTHVKRLNGAVVQNVNRVHKQEDGTITEDKKRSHQTFHSDNLRLQGSYAENFKLIYNTMGHIMFVMFLYEDKKGGISVLELPEGARLKHIVNHSGVNGREVGSKGLAKVQLVKIGNNPLVEQSRHNIGESDILSNGDIITFKKNESTTAHRGTVAREAMAAAMQALGPVRAAAKASRVARLALEKHSVTIPGELAGKTVFRYYDTIENIPSGVAEDVQRISEGGSKRNHFNVVYVVSHIPGTGKWGTSLAREIQVERPGGPVTLPLKAGMYKKDENGKTTQLSILAIPGLTAEETPALIRWLNETPQELDTFNTLLELPVKIKPADNETGVRYIIEMNGTSEFNEASLRAQWPLPETAVVKGGTVADAPAAVVLLKMYQRAIIQKSGEAVIKASTTVKNIIISAFRGPSDIGQLTDIGRNSEINSFMNVLPFNDPEDPLAENRAGDIALIDTDMFNIEAAEPAGSEKDYVDREKVLQRKLKMLGKSAKIFFAKDRPAKKEYERFIKTERIWLDPYAKRMAAQLRVSQSVVKYMQWLFDQQLKQAIKDVHAKDSTISFEIDINEANYDDALSAIQRWFMLGFDGVRINLHDTDSMTVDKITRIKEVINSAKPDATIMIEPANAAGIPAVVEGSLVVKQYHDIAPGEVLSGDVIVEMDRNSRPQASQINEMLTRLKGAGGIIYNMGDFEDTLPIGQDRRDNLRYRMRSDGNVERSVSIETTVQWVSALLEYAAANLPQSPRAFYRYYKEVALRMFNTIKANESEMEELAGRGHSDGVYEYRDPHNIHSASFSTIIALFNKMEEDAHGAYQQWAAPKEYISKLWVTYQKVSAADKENYEYALSGFVRGMMESLVEQRYIAAKTGDASLPPELSSDRATFRTLLMVADSLGIKGENVVGSLSRQRPSQHTAPIFELLTMARTSLERAEQAGTTATEVEAGVRTIINPLLSDILDNGQMPVSPSLSQVEAISELLRIFNSIAEKKMLSAARVIDNSAVPATQAILDMLAAG